MILYNLSNLCHFDSYQLLNTVIWNKTIIRTRRHFDLCNLDAKQKYKNENSNTSYKCDSLCIEGQYQSSLSKKKKKKISNNRYIIIVI